MHCEAPPVFETFLTALSQQTCVSHRPQGVAFLSAAKELYSLDEVAYACANIPILNGERRYTHCVYSSAFMGHWLSTQALGAERHFAVTPDTGDGAAEPEPCATIILKLPRHLGESAFLGITPSAIPTCHGDALRGQLRVLGSYFHEHSLRLNGHRSERQILLSARELDCLKWTAEGKTAWEASVILGISERTVRFHLYAAREKLKCATTTQAVAKAVRDNMIEL